MPRRPTTFPLRLSGELYDQVKESASRNGRSISLEIRMAIRAWLEPQEN